MKKSRMNKKKAVSRTSQSIPRETRKIHCFGRGGTVGEEATIVKNVSALQKMIEDSSGH